MTDLDPRLADLGKWLTPPKGGLWHGGPSVLSVTRGVSIEMASWRPSEGRHSIWELLLHIAYWKHVVHRRIVGGKKGQFPRSPSDWPLEPESPTESAWRKDRELLKSEHLKILELTEGLEAGTLDQAAGGSKTWTHMDLLSGIVFHDTYHMGQIQLMKRLYTSPLSK